MIVDSVNEIKGVSNVSRGHMHIQELEDGHVYIDSNISEAAHIAAVVSLVSQMSDRAFEEFLKTWNAFASRNCRSRRLASADSVAENMRLRTENENLRYALNHLTKEKLHGCGYDG